MSGLEIPTDWVEKAEVFLVNAERHLGEGVYWLACFEAHQASELYLEALIVALTGSHPYTHDLTELATYPAFKGEVCQASNIKY
jgi:HEPN domain-containing protein